MNLFYGIIFCPKCGYGSGAKTSYHMTQNDDYVNQRYTMKTITFFVCTRCTHSWTDEYEKELYYTFPEN
jgi:hypothetical protein